GLSAMSIRHLLKAPIRKTCGSRSRPPDSDRRGSEVACPAAPGGVLDPESPRAGRKMRCPLPTVGTKTLDVRCCSGSRGPRDGWVPSLLRRSQSLAATLRQRDPCPGRGERPP